MEKTRARNTKTAINIFAVLKAALIKKLYLAKDRKRMSRKKIELEYEMNTMPRVLYKRLATPEGLAAWFAEDVASDDGKIFSFLWHKEVSRAIVVESLENEYIRFQWEDDDEEDYFEFRIVQSDLSGNSSLRVTDFSDEEEYDDVVRLWNFQIEGLKRILAA